MEEAEEVFEEVLSSTEAMGEAELGTELEITAESGEVGEEVISMADEFDEVLGDLNEDYFSEFLSEDAELSESFDSEVSEAVDRSVTEIEESGAESTVDAGVQTGTELSEGGALQKAGADAVEGSKGLWQKIVKLGGYAKKVVNAFILVDFIGKTIDQIVSAIKDSTKNPPWKGSLSKEQREQLVKLQDAASSLKNILQGWHKGLEPLEKNAYFAYGTMKTKVGGRDVTVQVIDVVAYLIQDALEQLKTANDLVKNGIEDLTVFDLTQLSNNVFTTFADAQGIIDLRDNKKGIVKDDMLATMKFPPKADDTEVNKVLLQDFPQWKEKIQNQGFDLAKFGAKMAIKAFTKSQVIMKVNEFLRKNIYPKVKKAASDAGKKAAKDYVDGKKGEIIGKALIPIVGPEKAREYGKEVQKEAMKKGKDAAETAATAKANELKKDIEAQLKPVVKQLMDANKAQMKLIGKYAAKQILNAVVPPGSKSAMFFALPPGVSYADIGHVAPISMP